MRRGPLRLLLRLLQTATIWRAPKKTRGRPRAVPFDHRRSNHRHRRRARIAGESARGRLASRSFHRLHGDFRDAVHAMLKCGMRHSSEPALRADNLIPIHI